jgi:hypothetical protein
MLKYYKNRKADNRYQMHLTFVNSNQNPCTYPAPTKLPGAFRIIIELMKPLCIPLYIEDDASVQELIPSNKTEEDHLADADFYDMDLEEYKASEYYVIMNPPSYFTYKIRDYRILLQNEDPSIYKRYGAMPINRGAEDEFRRVYNNYKQHMLTQKTINSNDAEILLDRLNTQFRSDVREAKLVEFKLTDKILEELFIKGEAGFRDLIITEEQIQSSSSQQKYLKYKNKYLQLKNKLKKLNNL